MPSGESFPARDDPAAEPPRALEHPAGAAVGPPRTTIAARLSAARRRLDRLEPRAARDAVAAGDAVLVDVRAEDHVARDGAIPGALRFPRTVLEWRLDPDCPWRDPRAPGLDERVVLVCDHGYSSSLAACDLQDLGFARATDLEGGFEAWAAAGLPVQRVPTPSAPATPPAPADTRATAPVTPSASASAPAPAPAPAPDPDADRA
jgi:rhodanese-related sulfurtransferase